MINFKNNYPMGADFKKLFEEYGSNVQAITIGTKSPIIEFKDKDLQEKWNEFSIKNNFTKIFQQLLKEIFVKGYLGLGLKPTKQNIPLIVLGNVVDYVESDFELQKITINLNKDYIGDYLKMAVFEEYDLTKKENNFIPIKTIDKTMLYDNHLRKLKAKDYQQDKIEKTPNRYEFIPWIVFSNKSDNKKDLAQELNFLFDALNIDFELLKNDGLISRSLIFQNGRVIKADLKDIILNPNETVININKLQTFLADPDNGMSIRQGNPQAQILIQKIEKQISWIEKFANLKINSANFGTKNLHSNEVESMNSNFNDLVESKANLYELQLLKFVDLWFKFCENHGWIIDKELNINEVDITVYGSTKWLLNEASKYNQVNQNGTIYDNKMKVENYGNQ